MSVNQLLVSLGLLIVGLPYVGPSFFGLGVKPLWILFMIIPILFWGKASLSLITLVYLGLLLEIARYFTWPLESLYGVVLWCLMVLFVFSSDLIGRCNISDRQLVYFQRFFYSLFFFLYIFNLFSASTYSTFLEIVVGQSRNIGRSDFSFLSPEPGLGAFSILTIAFIVFHLSKENNYWQLLVPCTCLIMIGSATSFGLTLLWFLYFYANISFRLSRHVFIAILAGSLIYFVTANFLPGFALARFEALWYFDIGGESSVSHRARDILRLVDFFAISNTSDGPVGFVKAAVNAPIFAITLVILFLFYCKLSSGLLVLPALIFLPITHPFIWVMLSFSRVKKT